MPVPWIETTRFEDALCKERPRIVRLCASLTGNAHVAEDLAQETLVEAWRNLHKVHDPDGLAPWLAAIARNVCRRWGRQQKGETGDSAYALTRMTFIAAEEDDWWPADETDLQVELERDELADLLDRALALLPANTRDVLVATYIGESSHAELAARLNVSEGAIKLRLHRGRLALRRVLHTYLREDLVAYDLAPADGDLWHTTRLWCAQCGQRHLDARFDQAGGLLLVRCPQCDAAPGETSIHTDWPTLLNGVAGVRAALSRVARWADPYYRAALPRRTAPCIRCGGPTELQIVEPVDETDGVLSSRGVRHYCPRCDVWCYQSLDGLVLFHPLGQQFWRAHKRLHALPERLVETYGRPAIVRGYERVGSHERLVGIFARDTYEVLDIRPSAGATERG